MSDDNDLDDEPDENDESFINSQRSQQRVESFRSNHQFLASCLDQSSILKDISNKRDERLLKNSKARELNVTQNKASKKVEDHYTDGPSIESNTRPYIPDSYI